MSALAQEADRAKTAAWARALAEGWAPIGMVPDQSGGFELMSMRDDLLYMYETGNRDAAISTATDTARSVAPNSGSAAGQTIGVWDQGTVRTTHREFGGRASAKDSGYTVTHATHVAGTLAAAGVDPAARGMAPDARIDSYDWNSDLAEATSRAMREPGEAGMIQISSHSYGFISGWANTYSPARWYGTWGEPESSYFGMYDWYASQWDQICYNAPYYLPFKSAGNNRSDYAPAHGASFQYYDGGWKTRIYNSTTDPKGDGQAQGGYDSIPLAGNAKNVITVGAIHNAVDQGVRSVGAAQMTSYSGWGPADDGRVKPDLVAKGSLVYSCRAGGDADYTSMSGTSMATPNAAGSAAVLAAAYARLFPGQAILASALKGLILHTADDLGNPGPDYVYGWGLMNTKAAMDLLQRHAAAPFEGVMVSASAAANEVHEFRYEWNGSDPVRVTLCWTDPAGKAVNALDSRVPRLVNDLDLRVVDAQGTTHLPYVLDAERPDASAARGDNSVDNVEQVRFMPSGPARTLLVQVVAPSTVVNGTQVYSLTVSGLNAAAQPEPPSVQIEQVAPPHDGTGRVKVSALALDADSPAVAVEVQYAADAASPWLPAWIAEAECGGQPLAVNNLQGAQIPSLNVDGNASFCFTWDTLAGAAPLQRSFETRLRVRVWDGDAWSEWATSAPFAVNNSGPDASQVTFLVSTWAFERYVVSNSVTISFTNFTASGAAVVGYLYGTNSDPVEAQYTTDEYFQVHDLARGAESTIYLWAVDEHGALSRPILIPVFVLEAQGNWDGTSEPTPDMLEGSAVAPPSQDFLLVEASAAAGVPILRFPYLPGKKHTIEALDVLDRSGSWRPLRNLNYTVDHGWIVWVSDPATQGDPGTQRFFRVRAE